MASSTLSKPDDVPQEFRERTLFHFLLTIDMKKYGVKPEDAWRDFGRCILAEKQLDLARRAVGPDLDKNVIVSKHNFYKLQNELKEKTEEIENLSTSTGTDKKGSEKDLTKEGAGEQPKPSEEDNDTNNQDTTVTDPEKEEDTTADPGEPNLDRNEESNEKVNSEDQTSEKTDDKASSDDQNKELLESAEQPNIQQSAGKETSEEKKEEDKPEQSEEEEVPNKAPEEEDGGNEPDGEEEKGPGEEEEDRKYRADPAFPMIERHAREFRKAAAATSAKTKSTFFIKVELPNLVTDEGIREDLRTLTYVRKCVELCWYMCMQDPPMVIISPERGQEIDKGLFSLHGRRGKTVEVCVWPALLLHDGGPLVCKGYVLPEERKLKK
ncbi:ESF1 homolog [Saccostrea cucullata]|uniref:ESF1 homolog n=1 Tax=Saccostrea cuccullata TaxID=36930 RepID=UPI002ED5FB9B